MPNQVSTAVFWDHFYGRTAAPDEWYLSFDAELMKYITPEMAHVDDGAVVLHLGCGGSDISNILAATLRRHFLLMNMDFSGIILKRLKMNEQSSIAPIEYQQMDARYLPYRSNSIDIIIDKGTMDSILSDSTKIDANSFLVKKELHRVLKPGGKVLSVSTFWTLERERYLTYYGWDLSHKVIPTTPFEYPDQKECYLYIMTKHYDC
ncbi:hypothetical protein THRCLA_04880 [Thraustotheca clavata]|uniref:Methyltransferase type 11 domain-containing protein n=1 Tax=Thraustotheca clavata TaxID=74557 RepID=A0A1V9ZXP5_9STRA|nr:hypothetical protein THRCLA_04880 [Thraustotheca clavata]